MKLRVFQVLFVAVALLVAALIVRHGQPHLLPATQAQQMGPMGLSPASPKDAKAAVTSIQAQLTAFRKNDFQTAMRYQSADLKGMFHSTEMFREMMQHEYSPFLHFQSARYHVIGTPNQGRTVMVFVTLHMPNQSRIHALYIMDREMGGYRVQGVQDAMPPLPYPPPGSSNLT